jgi:hypothetical protein
MRVLKKVRKQPTNSADQVKRDYSHNRDLPSCQLLQSLARQTFSKHQESTAMLHVLRALVFQQRQEDLQAKGDAAESTGATLPPLDITGVATKAIKTRRKKKKKITNEEALSSTDTVAHKNGASYRHAYLDEYLDTLLQSDFANLNLELSSPSRLEAKLASIRIPHSVVLDHVQFIACKPCRDEVAQVLQREQRVLLQLPCSSTANSNNEEASNAFDYIAMEEGISRPPPPEPLAFVLSSDSTSKYWQLNQPCTLEALRDWTYHYVLGRGLSQDEILRRSGHKIYELSPDAIRDMLQTVRSECLDAHGVMRDASIEAERLVEIAYKKETQLHAEKNVDMQTFIALRAADKNCHQLLLQIRDQIVLPFTQRFLRITGVDNSFSKKKSLLYDDTIEMREQLDNMWRIFFQTIHKCAEAVAQYESELFALADRQGVFPPSFFSAICRERYREMVKCKLRHVFYLINDIVDVRLDAPVDSGIMERSSSHRARITTTFAHKVCTRHYFVKYFADRELGGMSNGWDQSFVKVDDAWKAFLNNLCSCCETVDKPNIDKTLLDHDARRQRLNESWLIAIKSLEELGLDKDSRLLRLDDRVIDPSTATVDEFSDSESLESFRGNIELRSFKCTQIWLNIRQSRTCMGVKDSSMPRMPVAALKSTFIYGADGAPCYGGYGENRASSVLVALFYDNVSKFCDEWRAEIAEEELLFSVEHNVEGQMVKDSPANERLAKNAKKKTRKKKVKPNGQFTTDSGSLNTPTGHDGVLTSNTEKDKLSLHRSTSRTNAYDDVERMANGDLLIEEMATRLTPQLLEPQTAVIANSESTIAGEIKNDNVDVVKEGFSGKALNSQHGEVKVPNLHQGVGVIVTNSRFLSAEEFLMGRLKSVMKSARNKFNIV